MSGPAAIVSSVAISTGSNTIQGAFGPAMRSVSYLANSVNPNTLPEAMAVLVGWNRGFLGNRAAATALAQHGVWTDFLVNPMNVMAATVGQLDPGASSYEQSWRAALELTKQRLTPEDLIVCLNRGLITEASARDRLQKVGMVDPADQDPFLQLRFAIPGSSDLIMMAVKEAWDEPTVRLFGYDAEFPNEFQFWMERQGFGSDARTDLQRAAGKPPVTWPQLYWRAHWNVISPTQAYEMFQRLRPNRVALYQDVLPGLAPFGLGELKTILKVHDYPVPFRDQLAAIAYNKPRLVDIRRLRCDGVISATEVYEQYLDYGYAPVHAKKLADWTEKYCYEKNLKKIGVDPKKAILDAYCRKLLTREQAASKLYEVRLGQQPGQNPWFALNPQQQAVVALQDWEVELTLRNAEFQCWLKKTDQQIKRIKMRYQRGQWNYTQTARQLREVGMTGDAAAATIDEWDDELSAGKLMFSTERIRALIVKQLLPVPLAMTWLTNLGWREPELSYIIAEAQYDLQLAIARQQEKLARTLAARQKAQLAQLKAIQREQRQLEQKLMRTLTPAMAKRYFVRGLFTEPQLRTALAKWDYAGTALETFVAEAKQERVDYLAAKERQRCRDIKSGPCEPPSTDGKTSAGTKTKALGNGTTAAKS